MLMKPILHINSTTCCNNNNNITNTINNSIYELKLDPTQENIFSNYFPECVILYNMLYFHVQSIICSILEEHNIVMISFQIKNMTINSGGLGPFYKCIYYLNVILKVTPENKALRHVVTVVQFDTR